MPGLNPTSQDYEQFIEITGAERDEATHFLENGTTLQGAIEDFFAAREAGVPQDQDLDLDNEEEDEAALEDALMADQDQSQQPPAAPSGSGGARTLGGQAVDTTLPEGWGKKEKKTGRVGEWSSGGGQGGRPMPGGFGGGGDDDSEDEDDARRGEKNLYTGGEKSGLAVENPDRKKKGGRGIVEDILKQASSHAQGQPQGQPQAPAAPAQRSGFFGGSGNTLGSEDTPPAAAARAAAPTPQVAPVSSSTFDSLLGGLMGRHTAGGSARPAPTAEDEDDDEEEEVQTRQLVFWRNGFSIEDGPLMEYDAPGNPELLRAIQSGRAPPSLFGVRYNQPLQVEVQQRTSEEYVKREKKKPVGGFGGEGNRLGSVAPEVGGAGAVRGGSGGAAPAAAAPVSQGGSTGNAPKFQVDETKPTTRLQLRLADGSKLVATVNLTHTVEDLRNFIMAASPASNGRAFILQTTFPNKELSNQSETIEAAGLKNAVIVQRFT